MVFIKARKILLCLPVKSLIRKIHRLLFFVFIGEGSRLEAIGRGRDRVGPAEIVSEGQSQHSLDGLCLQDDLGKAFRLDPIPRMA